MPSPAWVKLLGTPCRWPDTLPRVSLIPGTTSGCLQVGQRVERPANSGLTWNFMPQWEQEKLITENLLGATPDSGAAHDGTNHDS